MFKRVKGGSIYKYVTKHISKNPYDKSIWWSANLRAGTKSNTKYFQCEREAAKAVDLFRINNGLEPINILIRKP